jgi:hypothetical protein
VLIRFPTPDTACKHCQGLVHNELMLITIMKMTNRSRGSSVCIVSGYELGDRAMEVRSPAEARHISSNLCVQTGSGAYPASCPMGTVGPFLGGKELPGRDADHSPYLVPRS